MHEYFSNKRLKSLKKKLLKKNYLKKISNGFQLQ